MSNRLKNKHDFFMKHNLARLVYLFLSLCFGLVLALIYAHYFEYITYPILQNIINNIGLKTISLSFISLPTLTLLWYFRTYDTRDLIQKNEENTNTTILTNALNMYSSSNKNKQDMGEKLLQILRDDKEIYKDLINKILNKRN